MKSLHFVFKVKLHVMDFQSPSEHEKFIAKGWIILAAAAAAAKLRQSCPTLCDPIDSSPPGSPIPGILQGRTLEWVAISFNAWRWKVKVKSFSRVWPSVTPWTAAFQAPQSMGFSRQEYWSGVPFGEHLFISSGHFTHEASWVPQIIR